MNQDKYIKIVLKNINCSKKDKLKIKEDLKSDISIALANGETWLEIMERLGSPKELADDLNENFDYPVKSNSKRNLFIGIFVGIVAVAVVVIMSCLFNYFVPESYPINESKIFDENTLNEQVQVVVNCLNADDYDELMNMSNDLIKQSLSHEDLKSAIKTLGELGDFKSITRTNFVEVKNRGEVMAVGEVVVLYDQKSVTYTISFDEDMKLVGLYMK